VQLLPKVFKGIKEANSAKVRDYVTDEVVNDDVSFFLEEISDIGTTKKTDYVVLGEYNSEIGKQSGNISWTKLVMSMSFIAPTIPTFA